MARIVVIEPHDNLRRQMETFLQLEGHTVRVAKTLSLAKGELGCEPVDIVLSETRLGTQGLGLEVLEVTNRLSPRPLVIFTTASERVSLAVKALKRGAYDYLVKPFRVEEFRNVIQGASREFNRKDVFICHASVDKQQFVNPFVRSLRAKNVSFWLDEAEIGWGDSITDKISEGLLTARHVVVFLTSAFLRRRWPAMEMKTALSREAESGDTIVLPVLAEDPTKIFQRYPLLRDKSYATWDDGPDELADRVRELLIRRRDARHVVR